MALPLDIEGTWWNSTVSLDAGELRRADTAMFGGAGAALGVSGGIVRHGDTSLLVTVDGSDVVTVKAGAVVIPGNAVSGTGCYRAAVATDTTGNLTARNATNGRIDLVVFRALDTDVVPGHGAFKARVEIIAGTPSGSPAVPTLPTMAVELGRISVPATAGGTATVDLSWRSFAHAVGGEMLVPTNSRLPAAAPKFQQARALDTGLASYFDGTSWVSESVPDVGWTALTVSSPFTSPGGAGPRFRILNGVLYLDGNIQRSSGFSATFTTAATLPSPAYYPAQDRYVNENSGSIGLAVKLTTAGLIQVSMAAATTVFLPIQGLGGYPL